MTSKFAIRNLEEFGIDRRGLRAFQVALGLLVATSTLLEAGQDLALAGENGVVNADLRIRFWLDEPWLLSQPAAAAPWSGVEAVIAVLTLTAAAAMIGGWYPRAATLICWVLLAGTQDSAPLVNYGADHLLRLFLFWSIFLPRPGKHAPRVVSVASAALLLQAAAPYIFAGIHKWNDTWLSGAGLGLSLEFDIYTRLMAPLARQFPALLSLVSQAMPAFEILVGIALLLPFGNSRIRLVAVLLISIFHLGAALLLATGLFPLVSLAGLLVFLPPRTWDQLERRFPRVGARSATRSAPVPENFARAFAVLRESTCAGLLMIALAWNLAGFGVWEDAREQSAEWSSAHGARHGFRSPLIDSAAATARRLGPLGTVGSAARLHQRWDMFAVLGPNNGGWPVLQGETAGGQRIDLLEWREAQHPAEGKRSVDWPSTRWRALVTAMRPPGRQPLRCRLALTRARQWNRENPENPLISVSFGFVGPDTRQPGRLRTRKWITLDESRLAPGSGACSLP